MNARVQKLVEVLRSGEYKQGQGRLLRHGYYCCLGVACDIYRRETGNGQWSFDVFRTEHEHATVFMPSVVQDWFGFRDDAGEFDLDGNSLASLNDDENKSFAEIADAIEAHEKELFRA